MIITIVTATYNAESVLENLINSIISQKTDEIEFIIIDGGSTDGTIDIIKKYENNIDYWISEPDKGIYDAWNKGVNVANGEWIMFLGADDELLPNAINDYLVFLNKEKTKKFDLISSKREMYDLKGNKIRTVGSIWEWPSCLNGMPISHPAALHNKFLFRENGIFNIDYKIAGDYELLLRKGKNLKAAFINKITVKVSEGGVSDSYLAIKEYYKILKNKKEISKITAFKYYNIMYTKYTINKILRLFSINIHS